MTGSTPQLAFVGGTTLSPAGVLAASLIPSLSNRALYALDGGTTFDSQGVAALDSGRGSGNRYVYNVGYGCLEINDHVPYGSATATLNFGPGILLSDCCRPSRSRARGKS